MKATFTKQEQPAQAGRSHADQANAEQANAEQANGFRPGRSAAPAHWTAALRLGLGAVFVIGGLSKLNLLLDPAREGAILALYMGPHGYINAFFAEYLFAGPLGDVLTPWRFLTALSTWELLSGLALWAGFLVRPIAFAYGFLLWTFVIALPVVTTPGIAVTEETYQAPAILVQIRDIGLAGMMWVLFNLGAGIRSVDARFGAPVRSVNWDHLGLLLRLSVAAPLIVGGLFAGMNSIQSFATAPWLLTGLGIFLAAGIRVRELGLVVAGVMIWYALSKISLDQSPLANLNGFKREIAFFFAGLVLAHAGGGSLFTAGSLLRRLVGQDSIGRPVPSK